MKKVFFLPVIIFSFVIKITFAQGGCWSTKASLSVARTLVSVVEIKGVIYAIGGSLSGHLSTAVVEAYDTTTGNWNFRTNLPIPLCAAATCVYENKIYVFGGFPYGEAGLTALDSVYEYDPPLNLWTKKTSLPIKVGAAIAQTVNNKIYIIGGCNGNLSNVYHSVYEYDPISDACKTKRDMPTARYAPASAVIDGKIYVFGGGIDKTTTTSAVEVYDPVLNHWDIKSSMPYTNALQAESSFNGKIFLFGGGATAGSVYNLVKEYNPLLDTWTNKANIPTGRWGLGSCIIGSEIYLIGGADAQNNRLDKVEVYRPELDLTDINEQDNLSNIPKDYKLYQNFPNPFNPSTTISWQSTVGSWQTLKVYDILGNEVATLVNEYRNAGNYEIDFQSSVGSYQLSNGVYFYQLRVGAFVETKKMILLK